MDKPSYATDVWRPPLSLLIALQKAREICDPEFWHKVRIVEDLSDKHVDNVAKQCAGAVPVSGRLGEGSGGEPEGSAPPFPLSRRQAATANNMYGRSKPMAESNVSGGNSSDNDRPTASPGRNREEHLQWVLQQVRQALAGLKFGQITITVQDGLAIQIERTEKTRLR